MVMSGRKKKKQQKKKKKKKSRCLEVTALRVTGKKMQFLSMWKKICVNLSYIQSLFYVAHCIFITSTKYLKIVFVTVSS